MGSKQKTKIKLGDEVRDTITEYKGKVVAITDWIAGCTRMTVQSHDLKDGKPIDAICFDEELLELVKEKKETYVKKGGDRPSTPRTGF